ncbi:MAG: group 1 glycosyl transferase [Frankiales bacterium]|nr:group 1 glycosyl transferase [Frankiales bacterium]
MTVGNRPTVALVTSARTPGGLWRHLRELAVGLAGSGIDVRVCVPGDADALRAEAARLHIPIADLGDSASADVVHFHLADTYDRAALAGVLAARRRKPKIVITEHLPRTNASDRALATRTPRPGATAGKSLAKAAQFAAASRVIAVGEGSKSFLLERYRLAPSKVIVVHNGVRMPADGGTQRPARPTRAAGPHFVAAGTINYQKGFDVLIAAAELAGQPWTVDVWGDGAHREGLQARAGRTTGPDGNPRIVFRGWTDELNRHLIESDGLVMPSRWEAFPYTSLEAMAVSRAVVGTRVDGLDETIVDGVTGLLVAPQDPAALAVALDALSTDPELREQMGVSGRVRVAAEYRLDQMIAETLDVYAAVTPVLRTALSRIAA